MPLDKFNEIILEHIQQRIDKPGHGERQYNQVVMDRNALMAMVRTLLAGEESLKARLALIAEVNRKQSVELKMTQDAVDFVRKNSKGEIDRLTAELASVTAERDAWQRRFNGMADAFEVAEPPAPAPALTTPVASDTTGWCAFPLDEAADIDYTAMIDSGYAGKVHRHGSVRAWHYADGISEYEPKPQPPVASTAASAAPAKLTDKQRDALEKATHPNGVWNDHKDNRWFRSKDRMAPLVVLRALEKMGYVEAIGAGDTAWTVQFTATPAGEAALKAKASHD